MWELRLAPGSSASVASALTAEPSSQPLPQQFYLLGIRNFFTTFRNNQLELLYTSTIASVLHTYPRTLMFVSKTDTTTSLSKLTSLKTFLTASSNSFVLFNT